MPESEHREVLEELFVFGKENQRLFLNRMAVLLIVSKIIACCGLWSVVCFSCCCHWRHAGCPDDASYKANQSEELTCWLEENQLYIEDVKIDYERNILYLKLIGPKPPLNVEKHSIRKTGKNL